METIKGHLIYYIDEGKGLVYRNLKFYSFDTKYGKSECIVKMPIEGKKGAMGHCRLTTRLMRMEPRCVGCLDNHRFVVNLLGKVWLLDVMRKEVKELQSLRVGYSVLNFCEKGGCLYWGDYGANTSYDEVNIYRLDGKLNLSVVYRFPKGNVRHIHNIITDGDGFIILTGDNETRAGIYRANANWSEVEPWKIGEQKYRAVVGFPYQGGLLYATDSVETENHLRLIGKDGEEKVLKAINGSCIYGGETNNYYFFSTTVEPHEGGGLRKLLSYELGGGVKSRDAHLVAVRKSDLDVKVIKKMRKDIWPMKLFQYGSFMFPKGMSCNDDVWAYVMACKKLDGKTIIIKKEEVDEKFV